MLLVPGVPARVVMEILGHSDISLTSNTYSYVTPGLRKSAAARMDDLLSGARATKQERPAELGRELYR
jgi:integrase